MISETKNRTERSDNSSFGKNGGLSGINVSISSNTFAILKFLMAEIGMTSASG